jgi:hypothetical protein
MKGKFQSSGNDPNELKRIIRAQARQISLMVQEMADMKKTISKQKEEV